jgi:type IV secretory pathway VirJ component
MHLFLDDMKHAHLVDVPHSGHGFANQPRWAPPFDESFAKLLAADNPAASRAKPPSASAAEIEKRLDALNLPLEFVWSGQPRAQMIFLSGDGGWADIDQKVSAYLAAHGVSVVGISSVKYFWSAKTPQQTAADVRRVLDVIGASNVPTFIGGYSFGADVTPFVVQQWRDADRRRIAGEALIGASETAAWQISVLDYVFRAKETPQKVVEAVRSLKMPTLCLTGDKVAPRDTACDDLANVASVVVLPGNHHFGGNYDAVGAAVMAFIDRQLRR